MIDLGIIVQNCQHICDILRLVCESDIVLNQAKFQFAQKSVEFAEFRVNDTSIEPLPKYLDAMRYSPKPKTYQTFAVGSIWYIRSPTTHNCVTLWHHSCLSLA